MEESNVNLDKIERYSKGNLDLSEKLSFEKELENDPILKQQLELSKIVDQMIIGAEALKLKEQMQKDLFQPKVNISTYIALTITVICFCYTLYYIFYRNEDNKTNTTSQVLPPISISAEKAKKIRSSEVKSDKPVVIPEDNIIVYKPEVKSEPLQNTSPEKVIENELIKIEDPDEVVNTIQKQNALPSTNEDPCIGLVGEVEFYTVPSCEGEETGEVHLKSETIKGGVAPYTFIIGSRNSNLFFDRLASGSYSLFIKDANGCMVENSLKVLIPEKVCKKTSQYVFNPEYDRIWTIPYNNDKNATNFKIIARSGNVVYQTTVSQSQPSEWTGESNTGYAPGIGLHFFLIEYTDGSVEEGSVLVTR